MSRNEDFNIGSQGIDTQYERDYINYRPVIDYTTGMIDSTSGLSADTASQQELEEITQVSIISVWEDIVDLIQQVNTVEETLSDKLEDISVSVGATFQEAVKDAAEELGYTDFTDTIPFELYKLTFESPESPGSSLIQDIYEEYLSDVTGNLNGELYADVAEIKNDWKDMLEFIQKGLFTQIVSIDKVPTELTTDDARLDEIHEQEKQMAEEYAALLKLDTVNTAIYEQLYAQEYGSDRYYESVKEMEETRRELINMEKKLFTKAETVDLIERKASDTSDSIELITNSIDFDPYDESKYEVLYGLLKQFSTKSDMQTGLRKMQAVLKLSVDGKKTVTDAMKLNLRGIAGNATKKKINRTLVNGIQLRTGVFNEVYDIMNYLDGIPNSGDFETMATHIADGIQQAELMYQSQASDFYKIHSMDSELRTDKLASVIDKDAARSTYQLIDKVLAYAKDIDTSWPTEDKLSSWLNGFMEHSNLT